MPLRSPSLMTFGEALAWAKAEGVRWEYLRDGDDYLLRAVLAAEVVEVDSTDATDWGWMFIHVMRELRARRSPTDKPPQAV